MSCTPTKTGKSCCRHPEGSLNSYKAIVEAYIRDYRKPLADMLASFKRMPHRDAVKYASHGQMADGKRHPHQRRLTKKTLSAVHRKLQKANLKQYRDFESLHQAIDALLGKGEGAGPLMKYDTALRIGANLRVRPARVYLHSGTRIGAMALGFSGGESSIERSSLPDEFRRLKPHELEDCLCIFKAHLQKLARRR